MFVRTASRITHSCRELISYSFFFFLRSDFVYIAREMTVLARALNFDILELYVNLVVLSIGPSPDRLYGSASSYTLCEL